jgi:hypothetical protein
MNRAVAGPKGFMQQLVAQSPDFPVGQPPVAQTGVERKEVKRL